ncbi:hypothetical protein F53441_9296 [Fusarium austroafricanum]|uniref:Uncharacterized protein n=1 Tax=Fusarium austroafricanum TaxID=2364996 RepID=A0A8H4NWI4_9HYPO|nr:hypothetical protein F53441_9296 [Fusarium austroafricanum]
MFQPKEPFDGQETIEPHLIEPNTDDAPTLSLQCVKFTKERPDDFLNYLRVSWERDGPSVLQSKDLLKALKNIETKPHLGVAYLPLPKLVYLRNRETLQIHDGSLATILEELDKKEADVVRAKQLYHALDSLRPELSKLELSRLKASFEDNCRILMSENDPSWHRSTECVWAPKLPKSTQLTNPSEFYPELESLFVHVLGLRKINIGLTYNELIKFHHRTMLDLSDPPEEHAKRLPVSLSEEIGKYGHLLDKNKLLESEIFPIFGTDEKYMYERFRGKLDMLDFDPNEACILSSFLSWTGLIDRILSHNLVEICELDKNAADEDEDSTTNLHVTRTVGLFRIAMHYESPRAATQAGRKVLYQTLRNAKVHNVVPRTLKPQLHVHRGVKKCVRIESPLPGVKVQEDDGLHIYMDRYDLDVSNAVLLPRHIMGWIMTDPETKVVKDINEQAVDLASSILRVRYHKRATIKKILDVEGIVDVEKLQKSPYFQQRKKKPAPRVFGAEPSPPPSSQVSSLAASVPNSTPTPAQASDSGQQVWTLNLPVRETRAKSPEDPGWIKFF